MRILVLDDEHARHNLFLAAWGENAIVHAWTAESAIGALAGDRFHVVTLDHDLGPASDGDGLLVARYIARMPEERRPEVVYVHSANPVGAQAMVDTLLRADIMSRRIDPLALRPIK